MIQKQWTSKKEQNLIAYLLNVHNLKNRIKYYFQVQLLKRKKFKHIMLVNYAKFIIYIKSDKFNY